MFVTVLQASNTGQQYNTVLWMSEFLYRRCGTVTFSQAHLQPSSEVVDGHQASIRLKVDRERQAVAQDDRDDIANLGSRSNKQDQFIHIKYVAVLHFITMALCKTSVQLYPTLRPLWFHC
jgi:hypothetical protein